MDYCIFRDGVSRNLNLTQNSTLIENLKNRIFFSWATIPDPPNIRRQNFKVSIKHFLDLFKTFRWTARLKAGTESPLRAANSVGKPSWSLPITIMPTRQQITNLWSKPLWWQRKHSCITLVVLVVVMEKWCLKSSRIRPSYCSDNSDNNRQFCSFFLLLRKCYAYMAHKKRVEKSWILTSMDPHVKSVNGTFK